MLYFDYAGATPVDPRVQAVYNEVTSTQWANPSAFHAPGRAARALIEQSRRTIATLLSCNSSEIIFTASATESNALVLNTHKIGNYSIVMTSLEHDSILSYADIPDTVSLTPVTRDGFADIDQMIEAITPSTRLITIPLASSEIGTIQDITTLRSKLNDINARRISANLSPVYLHTDATQAPVFMNISPIVQHVDYLTLSGSKIYGPKGIAILVKKNHAPITPLLRGGGHEDGIRSGSYNTPAIVAFAEALSICANQWKSDSKNISQLRDRFIMTLKHNIQHFILNGFWLEGDTQARLADNLHFTIPGVRQDTLLTALDMNGVYVTSGTACRSGAHSPSKLIQSISPEGAHIRATLGRYTTDQEVNEAASIIIRTINELQYID